jgi:hypothetical protein
MVAAAIAGAAVIGGGASIISSNKASKTAKNAAETNNQLQRDIYNENKAVLAPYVGAGNTATPAIQALLGLTGDATTQRAAFDRFREGTGYDFRLGEGQKAIDATLSRNGQLDSGAAVKAALRYNQGFASNEFGNYYGALTGQQQIGLGAASAQAGVGQNFANATSANNNNAANTSANAALSNAGAINSVLQSGLSAYTLSQGLSSSYGGGAYGIKGSEGIY